MPLIFYSAVFFPPNLAEMQLMTLKRRVFYSSGAVSSWALRPLVPVFISEKPFSIPDRGLLPAVPSGGIRVDKLKKASGHLSLGSGELEGMIGKFTETAGLLPGKGAQAGMAAGFPGDLCGLHLLDLSDENAPEAVKFLERGVSELPETALVWKSLAAAVLKVRIIDDGIWWKGIETELLEQISLRRAVKQR